jgi:hypothetical protein
MHVFDICDVRATFIAARALGHHVFGLEGDQTLYATCLSTLQHNVGMWCTIWLLHPLANALYTHWNHLLPRWVATLG